MKLIVEADATAAKRAAALAYLAGSLMHHLHELTPQQRAGLIQVCTRICAAAAA